MGSFLAKASESFSSLTLIGIEAALQAGDLLRRGFGTSFSISSKEGRHNLVTEYDYLSEQGIINFLRKNVPGSRFLAEESGESGASSAIRWIIDPLDGTVNFAHQIPLFAVTLAAEKEGEVICGVVYQPIAHELFVAEKNKGAFLNGKRLKVSPVSELKEAMLATGFPYNLDENPFHCIDHFIDVLKIGIPIRRLGSAAIDLAYTAAGRIEGFFEVGLKAWDCAAGKLLIEEAGGIVTKWNEQPFDIHSNQPLLASNRHLHKALSLILTRKTL